MPPGWIGGFLDGLHVARTSGTSGMGDRRRTLTPDALLTSEIPLPTLSEQRRIVDRIEAIAGKVEEARRLRREAEQCVREVFDSALSREISDLHSC